MYNQKTSSVNSFLSPKEDKKAQLLQMSNISGQGQIL